MKKRKTNLSKRIAAAVLAGAMGMGLMACGSAESSVATANDTVQDKTGTQEAESSSVASPITEDVTINIRIMNEVKNADKVIAKYEEMVADDPVMSKIHPNIEYVIGADYKDKLNMALSAQEDIDLMFCGSWFGLTKFIQEGDFADLTGYFNNDEFPGLKKAFSGQFLDAMTSYVRQEDGTYTKGIFGINMATSYEDSRGFMYREDLRKKYGCDEITDRDSLMAFVKTVCENEPDMIGVNLWNFFYLDSPVYTGKHDNVFSQDSTEVFGDQTRIYVGLSEDQKTVLNVVVAGDSEEEFAKMPEGYQYDFITEYAIKRTEWNPYLNPSRGETTPVEKPAAISYSALSEFENRSKEAMENVPGSEWRFYVIDDAQRNKEEGAVICDIATNNWLVVPEWSDKQLATMYFLDWMFGSQEAHDLFQYGIVGEDWEAIGDDGMKNTDISDEEKYVMPGYSFTWNPNYVRYSEMVLNNPEL